METDRFNDNLERKSDDENLEKLKKLVLNLEVIFYY